MECQWETIRQRQQHKNTQSNVFMFILVDRPHCCLQILDQFLLTLYNFISQNLKRKLQLAQNPFDTYECFLRQRSWSMHKQLIDKVPVR